MRRSRGAGKTVALLFLLAILILFALVWFDYIGLIHAKRVLAPIHKLFGLSPQSQKTLSEAGVPPNLDNDRIAKRLEALELRREELDKRESDVAVREKQIEQIAQELDDRQKSQDAREKTFNSERKMYDDREANIVQNSQNLTGMRPEKAVEILLEMDDQDVIDILRKTEQIAQQSRASSMVAYWLSLMPADRAAIIQRKMANAPAAID